MTDPSIQPVEIEVQRPHALLIRWADGFTGRIPLPALRRACPCAGCRTEREQQTSALPTVPTGATAARMSSLQRIELVGHYAMRAYWDDDHASGIYSFELLRALCAPDTDAADALGPAR